MECLTEFKRLDMGEENGMMKQFVDLPEEVIEGHILPMLKWNDLLRLRRVSTALKGVVNGFIKLHTKLAPEIEINETNKTLKDFMKLGIPSTKFFLDNDKTGDKFYENPDMADFVQLYGNKITHLRVTVLSYFVIKKEREFFDGLTNLESLEAATFEYFKEDVSEYPEVEVDAPNYQPPIAILSLKSLKVGSQDGRNIIRDEFMVIVALMSASNQLEHLMLPFSEQLLPLPGSRVEDEEHILRELNTLALTFWRITDVARGYRHHRFPEKPKLKTYDFDQYYVAEKHERLDLMEQNASPRFIELCRQCRLHEVKLKNVVASWLPDDFGENMIDPAIGESIVSLVNLCPSALSLNLINLEQINIKATSRCEVKYDWSTNRPSWPSLKKLVIVVDSERIIAAVTHSGLTTMSYVPCPGKTIFYFFFMKIKRPSLTEMELEWKEAGKAAVPAVDHIISACPNLKKLTLVNWPGTNKALCKLWSGLPALEEVCLDGCKELGNVAFVGEDVDNPTFLKLKNLKRLSLKNLDQMPKITDTLFNLVLKSLNLTHLTLCSAPPLKKITITGIQSLLNGSFATSIEKFPFKGWSLESCPEEDFIQLGSEFRSYDMI